LKWIKVVQKEETACHAVSTVLYPAHVQLQWLQCDKDLQGVVTCRDQMLGLLGVLNAWPGVSWVFGSTEDGAAAGGVAMRSSLTTGIRDRGALSFGLRHQLS
jgi:hypothetical protein